MFQEADMGSQELPEFYQAFLDWLSPAKYLRDQAGYLARSEPGTGQWFIDSKEYQTWLEDRQSTLLCLGSTGVGKTLLTSIVIQHVTSHFLHEKDVGVAYIYCNSYPEDRHDTASLLMTILQQLAPRQAPLPEQLQTMYSAVGHINRSYHHRELSQKPSWLELVQALHSVIKTKSRVLLIIDAIDECSAACWKPFLREILRLQARYGVNLLATSRSVPEIAEEFRRVGAKSLEIRASGEDVMKYLESGTLRLPVYLKLREDLISVVCCEWKLYLDCLGREPTQDALRHAIRQLPKENDSCDRLYQKMMEILQAQEPHDTKLATDIVSWVTFAKRPFTISELQVGLSASGRDYGVFDFEPEKIVFVCSGLVVVDQGTHVLQLVHETAREYLERTWQRWFPLAKESLGRACVSYLSLDAFGGGRCITEAELKERLRSNSFYEYAAQNWGYHARNLIPLPQELIRLLADDSKIDASSQVLAAGPLFQVQHLNNGEFTSIRSTRMRAMHLAAFFGAENMVTYLLGKKTAADARDIFGRTPIFWAAQRGHFAVVQLLLSQCSLDLNVRDNEGRTALSLAAQNGHGSLVEFLLLHGANSNLQDISKGIPLWYAADAGHTMTIKILLEQNKETDKNLSRVTNSGAPHSRGRRQSYTPLAIAAAKGCEDAARVLLDAEDIQPHTAEYPDLNPLWLAAEAGHDEVVGLILEKAGLDPELASATDYPKGDTLLHIAVKSGSVRVVEKLLATGQLDVNIQGSLRSIGRLGWTALSIAASAGDEPIVDVLLRQDDIEADIKVKHMNQTALSLAAAKGYSNIVKLLLTNSNADPGSKDVEGYTPLCLAAREGHETVVEQLLTVTTTDSNIADIHLEALKLALIARPTEKDPRRNYEGVVRRLLESASHDLTSRPLDGNLLLSRAVASGRVSLVKLLLDHNLAGIDTPQRLSSTPLYNAVLFQKHEIAELLLDSKSIDLENRDYDGQTILSHAAAKGSLNIVKLLLKKGSDPAAINIHGRTPLAMAAEKGHLEVFKELLAVQGANPNSIDQNGQTPLSIAAKNGHEEVVKVLLSVDDVEPDHRNKKGRSPLSLAAGNGHVAVVNRLLVIPGVDPDSRDWNGFSPLARAIYNDDDLRNHSEAYEAVVERLLQVESVNPNSVDCHGRTPLSWAAKSSSGPSMIALLLKRPDVHLTHKDDSGLTPLSIALESGAHVAADLLRRAIRDTSTQDPFTDEDVSSVTIANKAHETSDICIPEFAPQGAIDHLYQPAQSPPFLMPESPVSSRGSTPRYDEHMRASMTAQLDREVRIPLQPQSAHGEEDDSICDFCETIDLTAVFSRTPKGTASEGVLVAALGKMDATWETRSCAFCRLMAKIRPHFDGDTEVEWELRALSSTYAYLCEASLEKYGGFESWWIDTVFLTVGLPMTAEVVWEDTCFHDSSSVFIARSGSNCPYGLRALTVARLFPDTVDFGQFRGWIYSCVRGHRRRCNTPHRDSIPHLRLIDCHTRKVVRSNSPVQFVALSYVWGPNHGGIGTANTDEAIKTDPVVDDALQVTRELGYSYLWVDQHCIVQDDATIRQEQLRAMHMVYQSAEVTIIAAAGDSSSYGLPGIGPRARSPQQRATVKGHELVTIPTLPRTAIEDSTWFTRGWTYQEGLLARRRLIFTDHEVSYECHGAVHRESIHLPAHLHSRFRNEGLQRAAWTFPGRGRASIGKGRNRLQARLAEYTSRRLTFDHDILNGMLGILQVFVDPEQSIYPLCGVPILLATESRHGRNPTLLEAFATGLCWRLDSPGRRRPGFPSWSWTGWKGKVTDHAPNRVTFEAGFGIDVSFECDGRNSVVHWRDYEQLGPTEQAKLPQSLVLEISAAVLRASPRQDRYNWKMLLFHGNEAYLGHVVWDHDPEADADFEQRLLEDRWVGIILGRGSVKRYSQTWAILADTSKQPWERMGLMFTGDAGEPLVDHGVRQTFQLG